MANIRKKKPWEINGLKPTPESAYFNRRSILKKLGIATGGLLAAPLAFGACESVSSKSVKNTLQENNNFNFPGMMDLYPAEKNTKYKLVDRDATDEYTATHYNNFYEFISPSDRNIYNVYKFVDDFDTRDWKIEVEGHCNNPGIYSLEDLMKKFPLEERLYRHRCVERWAMAVPWTGFSLASLIKFLEPTSKARYIRMVTMENEEQMIGVKTQTWYPWPYYEGLRMDEAMNELSFLATGLYGKPIPKQNGAPIRLVTPWKYGYKSIKSIVKIEFVTKEPKTFWNKLAPNEYPFISNVDPDVAHPRWSQKLERLIPDGEIRRTKKYNGYGDLVAGLYS